VFAIDDELREFLQSGVAAVAGTASPEGRPRVTFVWGVRVHEERGRVSFFIEAGRSGEFLGDANPDAPIAITVGHPTTYRSVQLKGRVLGVRASAPEDRHWVERHQADFLSATSLVGDDPLIVRQHWGDNEDLRRVDIEVARAFDQTPGPAAGREL
jgi:hypothetical protein